MKEDCKKFLTEVVLKECFHDAESIIKSKHLGNDDFVKFETTLLICKKCGAEFVYTNVPFRTFQTITDLHKLYEALRDNGKWIWFLDFAINFWPVSKNEHHRSDFIAWLMCLNQPDQIEERAEMVERFYGLDS